MDLRDLLARDAIIPSLLAEDKKRALQMLAERAASKTGLPAHDIFNALIQRERLSSTGLGRGIAIPHVKLAGIDRIICFFAKLAKPIPFESHDGEPVDIIFFLLAPADAGADHLKALARISRLVRDPQSYDRLRAAKDEKALYTVLTTPATSHAA
ncbi:MAG: PTS sugar transporter subunit IIA [Hyphomicrobium sp.]